MILDNHYSEFPDNMHVTFEYPDGRLLVYENYPFTEYGMHGFDNGNVFYGTEGCMVFSRRGAFTIYLGRKRKKGPTERKEIRTNQGMAETVVEFLDSVRNHSRPKATAETAHGSCSLVQLEEIAFRTRRQLEFDPQTERFVDCDEANEMLTKSYRAPYELPMV